MTGRVGPSIELESPLGIANMVQVLSAILIIGGTLYCGPPNSEMLWLIVVGVLYTIGFVQLLMTRYLMQREKSSIEGAIIVAMLAMLFSFVDALVWGIVIGQLIPTVLYLIIFAINVPNTSVLRKQRNLLGAF
ncbi:MAG: hypothetical protein ACFFE2_11535 [Candidatus Thorarchaeota archaeon]